MMPDFDGTVILDGAEYPYILQDGHKRIFACIPSEKKAMAAHPAWGAENDIIPEAEIAKWLQTRQNSVFDLGAVGSPILDQDGSGGCAGWSATSVFNITWNTMTSTPQVFSPGFQYAQVNGGRDAGSSPVANMTSLIETGICLSSDNPREAIFKRNLPPAAYETAKRFKILKGYVIHGWEDMISAIALGRPVGHGMQLSRGYQNIDQRTGFPPYGGFGGLHAQAGRGLFYHPELKQVVILNQNSWNKSFGIQGSIYGLGDYKGCNFLTRRHFDNGYFEAWACVANVPDPQDPKGIPVNPS